MSGIRAPARRKVTALDHSATARTARLAGAIANSFYGCGLDLSARENPAAGTWSDMPEVVAVQQLRDLHASDRQVRLFLTFVSAVDRARDANRLWKAAADLYESRPEVFEPTEVAHMRASSLREVLSFTKVSQRHTADTAAWKTIAISLAEQGPTRRVVDEGKGDARELLEDVRSKRDRRARFPQLRGPKIAPLWIRIMAAPGGAAISHIHIIPVAVDIHVRRVTENLGVTDTRGLTLRGDVKHRIQSAWREAVSVADFGGPPQIAGTCAALDPALWLFGARGCSFCEKQHRRIPISKACDSCTLFDPPRTTCSPNR